MIAHHENLSQTRWSWVGNWWSFSILNFKSEIFVEALRRYGNTWDVSVRTDIVNLPIQASIHKYQCFVYSKLEQVKLPKYFDQLSKRGVIFGPAASIYLISAVWMQLSLVLCAGLLVHSASGFLPSARLPTPASRSFQGSSLSHRSAVRRSFLCGAKAQYAGNVGERKVGDVVIGKDGSRLVLLSCALKFYFRPKNHAVCCSWMIA